MKYLIVSTIFIVFCSIFISITGIEVIATNLIPSFIGLFVLLELIDILVSKTIYVGN